MRRFLVLLVILVLAPFSTLAEEPQLTLRTASSVEEVEEFLLLPIQGEGVGVQAGYIRYISQSPNRDPDFCKEYWIGGDDPTLDLTRREYNGREFPFHVGTMCTRAVYSMAMSVLGIDLSPGEMSAITGMRNLAEPYDMFSEQLGIERVMPKTNVFNTMMENYLSDTSYSPVYLYIQMPNGTYHALLVVAYMADTGRYLVVDPSTHFLDDEPCLVYFVSLNKNRSEIINSTFRYELVGSQVLQCYQWRLLDDQSVSSADESTTQ